MRAPITISTLHELVDRAPPDPGDWLSLLAENVALRIGSRPTLYGLEAVRPILAEFLAATERFGCCGIDVLAATGHWLIETDRLPKSVLRSAPDPCVIAVRSAGALVRDLRFYLDLASTDGPRTEHRSF